ncbi:MAG: TonB-dependent receptor, partial [Candidatus Marinimicrobia bacterium]|nr:TonB-dependent receptor [Candidatus Neomarinimicrobiota bacterium]
MIRSGIALYCSFVLALAGELAADNTITGHVVDAGNRNPIVGANIIIVGTADGAATNLEGYFEINTTRPYPLTLTITHIAYENLEVLVGSDTSINALLTSASLLGKSIFITGVRSQIGSDVSSAVEVITLESIETSGARDLGDVLRPMSSVNIQASNTGKQYISVRGSNPNEVAVFLDGLRLNDTNTGVADLSAIDLNDMERVELVKGGSSTLFGQGAFGGVVNITSHLPDSNRISYVRGIGTTDATDQDLAYRGSVRLGPVALGGNYSGKARRYDGSSTYTSIFKSGAGAAYAPSGNLSLKYYALDNFLELNTGTVAQSDKTALNYLRYSGSILRSEGWDLFAGQRNWSWTDRVFTNLRRDLSETTINGRVAHQIVNRYMNFTIQYDHEQQDFEALNTTSSLAWPYDKTMHNQLTRTNHGLTAVLRFVTDGHHPAVTKIRWEASLRIDHFATSHESASATILTDSLFIPTDEPTRFDQWTESTVFNRKFGFRLEGSSPRSYYSLFINQGHNKRPPSLNDLSLWVNNPPSFSTGSELRNESVSTTDIGTEIIVRPPGYAYTNLEMKISGGVFINVYDNKIAYSYSDFEPPVPYNVLGTQIRGYEVTTGATLLDRRLGGQFGYQMISVDDPRVYPNKPEYRLSAQLELRYPWLVISYD